MVENPDFDSLFSKEYGLKASSAARAVLDAGPIRYGKEGRFWIYDRGVWREGEDEIHLRISNILGERYRPAHKNTIRDKLRAFVPTIAAEPVPRYINFRNGLLDWNNASGPTLVPHDPEVPSTVQLPIDWDFAEQCPDFRAFMDDVIPRDDHTRVWELVGYMLLSGNPLHKAFLFAGSGRNGKGAMMRTITAMLGPQNVSNVPLRDFATNRFATAQLYGRLANACGDIDASFIENTGRIKEITGEDMVQAEHKFGQPFRFTAWCSMLFSANDIPSAADTSTGWLDRWEVISFPNYVGDRIDKTLEPRLQAEQSLQGIASWAVTSLRNLMANGKFSTSVSAQAAKTEFAEKSNSVLRWLNQTAVFERTGFTAKTKALARFQGWHEGEIKMKRETFYTEMDKLGARLGFTVKKNDGIMGYRGLSFKEGQPSDGL